MLAHVSIQCADLSASAAFYRAVLAPLGGEQLMDFGDTVGFGIPPLPTFWIGKRTTVPSRLIRSAVGRVQTSVARCPARSTLVANREP